MNFEKFLIKMKTSISNTLKEQISSWYKNLQEQVDNFLPRKAQREMIAEVARCLHGDNYRHLIIEAPTGVGKTLSYLLPGIAVARENNKSLVVSTANIALQDQIFNKDLPLLKKIIPELTFAIAFGRRRYVCTRNLAYLASQNSQQESFVGFFDDEDEFKINNNQADLAYELHQAIINNRWDGVRDHYPSIIEDDFWLKLSTDKQNCLGRNCSYLRECPFFSARKDLEKNDVIITNHALVIAALESESVLPDHEKMLLVLDEGHHIPDIARDSFEVHAEITQPLLLNQLENYYRLIEQTTAQFKPVDPPLFIRNLLKFREHILHCEALVKLLHETLLPYLEVYKHPNSDNQNLKVAVSKLSIEQKPEHISDYLFPMGKLPDELLEICKALYEATAKLVTIADFYLDYFNEQSAKHDLIKIQNAQLHISRFFGYWENLYKLWELACLPEISRAPISKWLSQDNSSGVNRIYFSCAALRVSDMLSNILWKRMKNVVLTSATLRSLNSFNRIQELSGLSEKFGDKFVVLDSPFTHHQQGKLVIPKMLNLPTIEHEIAHINEMAKYFKLSWHKDEHKAYLVLFNSHRAMERFINECSELRLSMLVQGDKPRYRLIELHCENIKAGEKSILIGLNSFAEGLDLRGDYLTSVHIHKIAFPPVNNPVVITESEWLKSIKRYPFDAQSLPQASFALIQQVGRLIRSHECQGEIVIYDSRLLTKPYGKKLLQALPTFPIEQPDFSA